MKQPTVLEALKNLTLLKFTRDRDGGGAKATIRLHGNDRETQVWWRDPPKGQRSILLHFRPYPQGWERLSVPEMEEASKEALLAITGLAISTGKMRSKSARKTRTREK